MNVIWLKDLGKKDVQIAGGKGAQLGELKKAGFNVPNGFVVTVEGCKELLKESKTVEREIIDAVKKLEIKLAVRSSATMEDQKDASFAGQMETYLEVEQEKIIETAKKCIRSLSKASSYSARKNIKKQSMAVVIQNMVDADKAGVVFSINPVNGNDEIVIEAGKGIGKKIVGGETIPDRYYIEKENLTIKKKETGPEPAVTDEEAIKIAAYARKIEKYYSSPQDIEWAYKGKGLAIIQARPITAIQKKWKKIISREYAVQYTELSLKCLSPLNKDLVPYAFYEQVYIPEDGNESCYVDEGKWKHFVAGLKEIYVDNPDNYEKFENDFIKAGTEYMATAKKISEMELSKKSTKELLKIYDEYLKKNLNYGPFIWMQFLINNFYSEKAKEIIKNTELMNSMLRPEKKAAAIKLSEIAEKWGNMSEREKGMAYENFKWMPCLDIHNLPWTKDEFESHISEFRPKENIKQGKIELSSKDARIISITRKLAYLKDLKDDFRRQGVMHSQKLFSEIAERIGISLKDISYATEEEVIDFLEKGKKPSEIDERQKGFAIYFNSKNQIECKSGKEADKLAKRIGVKKQEAIHYDIKGTSAAQGIVEGKVTIIKGVADLTKVRKGDIMVAVTTHPDYVPAMQKTSAIVTDEGGITSHAAIIAREYGLPCIVGTRNATKILKDGDRVEVNANTGEVRRLR